MTELTREPLVLVIDDVELFAKELLPEMFSQMGCRVVSASNVQEGTKLAAQHAPESDDPLDLVVLDMHMPLEEAEGRIAQDAGIRFLKEYRLSDCPVVVFTAYPEFSNCVDAVKAGATAYIPKTSRKNQEGGPDDLRETCRRLLFESNEPEEVAPTKKWMQENSEELARRYNGKWVAFVSMDMKGLNTEIGDPLNGVLLIDGDSFDEVRRKVIDSSVVLGTLPPIFRVRADWVDNATEEKIEDERASIDRIE